MKTKKLFIAALISVLTGTAFAQTFTASIKDGRNNVRFESDAPLENIVGTTNQVGATIMINPSNIAYFPKGKVVINLASLKTGIDLRDKHLKSEDYLNTDKYPNAEFMFSKLNSRSKRLDNTKPTKASATGKLTLHGVTKEITVPVTLTYFKEDKNTVSKQKGNLLRVKSSFEIKLSDYKIKVPQMLFYKLNETIAINIDIVASDMGSIGGDNPCGPMACNPCGPKKSKNPCNPCGPRK